MKKNNLTGINFLPFFAILVKILNKRYPWLIVLLKKRHINCKNLIRSAVLIRGNTIFVYWLNLQIIGDEKALKEASE